MFHLLTRNGLNKRTQLVDSNNFASSGAVNVMGVGRIIYMLLVWVKVKREHVPQIDCSLWEIPSPRLAS